MVSETTTPETDAALEYPHCSCDFCEGTKYAPADFARRLERERDAAVKQMEAGWIRVCETPIAELMKERDRLLVLWERDSKALGVAIGQRDSARAIAEDNRARYVGAERQRDELAEALRAVMVWIDNWDAPWEYRAECPADRDRAHALLAELEPTCTPRS